MAYVMLAIALGVLWWGLRRDGGSRAQRTQRLGVALIVIGVLWSAFAWWLVVPEVILVAGLAVFFVGWRETRKSLPRH